MSRKDDFEEDWVAEAQAAVLEPSNKEFNDLKRRLRRQAGYDLRWWERLILRVARVLRIDFRWK